MQPGQRAFDYPTMNAQATAMWRIALGQPRLNATPPQPATLRLRVVATIAQQHLGPLPGSASLAAYRRNRLDQRLQLRHIMSVRAGQDRRQRNTLAIHNHVMLAARFAFVSR